jgi:hypothetical protein
MAKTVSQRRGGNAAGGHFFIDQLPHDTARVLSAFLKC